MQPTSTSDTHYRSTLIAYGDGPVDASWIVAGFRWADHLWVPRPWLWPARIDSALPTLIQTSRGPQLWRDGRMIMQFPKDS